MASKAIPYQILDNGSVVYKSACRMCHGGCGVLVHVRDGRVVKVHRRSVFSPEQGAPVRQGRFQHPASLQSATPQASAQKGRETRSGAMGADKLGRSPGHHCRTHPDLPGRVRDRIHRHRPGHGPAPRDPHHPVCRCHRHTQLVRTRRRPVLHSQDQRGNHGIRRFPDR